MELEQAFFILEHGSGEGISEYLKAIKTIKENCVPVVHGHWKSVQTYSHCPNAEICECSICKDTVWVYKDRRSWKFCPNCGAKIDEVGDILDDYY